MFSQLYLAHTSCLHCGGSGSAPQFSHWRFPPCEITVNGQQGSDGKVLLLLGDTSDMETFPPGEPQSPRGEEHLGTGREGLAGVRR